MILKNFYDKDSQIVQQKVSDNYIRRIPSNQEYKEDRPDIKNTHLLSLQSKEFYMKLPGDNKMSKTKVQLADTNNLWLNLISCVLNF